MAYFCTLFGMQGFDYSCGTLHVIFHLGVSAKRMTTPPTGGMSAGCQVLKNSVKVLLLDSRRCWEAVCQLYVEGDSWLLQQLILDFVIFRKDKVAICKLAKQGTKLNKLANEMIEIVRCDSSFVDIMKTIPDLPITVEKGYEEEFATTRILGIVK